MVGTRGKRVDYSKLAGDDSDDNAAPTSSTMRPPPQKKQRAKKNLDGDDFNQTKPPPKKSRAKGKGSRMAGKLDGLMNLPVDIFSEVCAHLHPLDLLHLARSNKRLRQMLTSRDSTPLWRRSRASVQGLPDCPNDLSEPKYAAFMFERFCQKCEAPNARRTNYTLRTRFCASCCRSELLSKYNFLADLQEVPQEITAQIPYASDVVPNSKRRYDWDDEYLYAPIVLSVLRRYEAILPDEDGTKTSKLADVLRKEFTEFLETGAAMEEWHISQTDQRISENQRAMNSREASIQEKLLELGYEEPDFPIYNPQWIAMVRQPRELTPQIWRRIHPRLVPLLEASRRDRLEYEKQVRIERRQRDVMNLYNDFMAESVTADGSLKTPMFPKDGDLHHIPVVKALLENDTASVSEEMWNDVKPDIVAGVRDWRDRVQRKLVSILTGTEQTGDVKDKGEGKQKEKLRLMYPCGPPDYDSSDWDSDGAHEHHMYYSDPTGRACSPGSLWDDDPKMEAEPATNEGSSSVPAQNDMVVKEAPLTSELNSSLVHPNPEETLALASSAFNCKICYETSWYPDVLVHRHCQKGAYNKRSFTSKQLNVSQAHRTLIGRLLSETGLGEDCTYSHASGIKAEFVCKRCPTGEGQLMNFANLVTHFDQERLWYSNATKAVARMKDFSLPTLHDTHGVDSEEPLAARLDEDKIRQHSIESTHFWEKNEVLTRQLNEDEDGIRFRHNWEMDDSDSDSYESSDNGYFFAGGGLMGLDDARSNKRVCLLCPATLKGAAMEPALMETHIRTKHQKEKPDLLVDSCRERSARRGFGGLSGLFGSFLWS